MTNATELAAILHGAAFAPITDRAFLRISGPDATRWLNGMVTNNIKDLAPGEGNYNFLLNAQGRIQGDCTIYREPGGGDATFLLETGNWQLEAVQQHLDKFIIMDDVELSPVLFPSFESVKESGITLIGSKASEWITKLFCDESENPLSSPPAPGTMTRGMVNGTNIIILSSPSPQTPHYEIWFYDETEAGHELYILRQHKLIELSPETLEAYRILSATPRYGTDIRNTETAKDLPQETAQDHALNFNKGCYLGQEIVERIHSRGQVHRTFLQFTLTGTLPTLPAPLEASGKIVGELTSAAIIPLPEGDITLALGYARREALDRHEPLAYPGGTATPRPPK